MAHILIVDDDPAIQFMITDALSPHGHACETASTGREALQKIAKTRFDLVVLDRGLPLMNGLQVLKSIRADPASAKLKVIMCTGAGMMADAEEAFQSGATDYVVKPLNLDNLSAKVARHVAAKSA